MICWGDGSPVREFLFVEDLVEALTILMNSYDDAGPINVGTGCGVTIEYLVETLAEVMEFKGNVFWDVNKPNGTPVKITDVSKIEIRYWQHKTHLETGLRKTYTWFCDNFERVRK